MALFARLAAAWLVYCASLCGTEKTERLGRRGVAAGRESSRTSNRFQP